MHSTEPELPGWCWLALWVALGLVGGAAGCSLGQGAEARPLAPCALILNTAADWTASPALRSEIAARSAHQVLALTENTQRLFAVQLATPTPAACAQAASRLALDETFASGVSFDLRRARPPSPASSTAQ